MDGHSLTLDTPSRFGGLLIATWGLGGVIFSLMRAIARLVEPALAPFSDPSMTALHWVAYVGFVLFMAYFEGYRGFQKRFAPTVVGRAFALAQNPTPLTVLLAPAYCLSLFAAPRRRVIVRWILVLGIAAIVMLMRYVPQPYRGIVDAGVVVGLTWGAVAVVIFFVRGLGAAERSPVSDLPSAR